MATQIPAFIKDAINLVISNLVGIILFALPLILCIIFRKIFSYNVKPIKSFVIVILTFFIGLGLLFGILVKDKEEINSSYDLTFVNKNIPLSIEKQGVLHTFNVDLYRILTGYEEPIDIDIDIDIEQEEPIVEKEYTYHTLDIDFDSLIDNETNETIKTLHKYFSSQTGTLENDYTGLFKDKNLIVFVAESFNKIGVRQDATPTLYKMIHDGYYFSNYYSTSMWSTVGGELQFNTSLYPLGSLPEIWKAGTNYWPMGIGTTFKENGYSTYAYHDNSYNYLDRNKYLNSVGFDNYIGCGSGIEKVMNCNTWTESDEEMVRGTYKDWINEDNFMAYYMTVSGHGRYTYNTSINEMGVKHKDFLESLGYNYSEGAMAYMSSMVELDNAMKATLEFLEENGHLEDTVIVVVGDHYPYYLEASEENELAGKEVEEYIEISENNLIIYCPGYSGTVDKVACTMDVLPTIYNLFGIEYDSRLMIGSDIFSSSPGLAMFGNNSWVSDYATYYTHLSKYVVKEGKEVSDDYLDKTCKIVNTKIKMSLLLAQNDYYKLIWPK